MKKWNELDNTGKALRIAAIAGGGIAVGLIIYASIKAFATSAANPDKDFQKDISAGDTAFAKKDYALAKEKYAMALLIKPADTTVLSKMKDLDAAITNAGGNPNTPTNTTVASPNYATSDLPEGAKSCGSTITTHDNDYDYKKCDGDWFTRSKSNPKTVSVKGSIPNWKSLKTNATATTILNTAYPNG